MSSDRHASSTSLSPEENDLFLDILHEAPLYGHRKPTNIVGSIFYCLVLAGYAALAVGGPWLFHHKQDLLSPLLCSSSVALLVFTGIFQQYMVYQVQKIRLQVAFVISIASRKRPMLKMQVGIIGRVLFVLMDVVSWLEKNNN